MIDPDLTPTQGAKELAQKYTVAQLRDFLQTEFDVRPPSKAVKIEIAQQLDDMRHNATDMTGHWAEDLPQAVADHEAAEIGNAVHKLAEQYTSAQLQDRFTQAAVIGMRRMAEAVPQLAEAFSDATRKAARALMQVTWANRIAIVQSMGKTVEGKVVDVVLRPANPSGAGRVCFVVEHPHPHLPQQRTRTLHHMNDVKFEALTS